MLVAWSVILTAAALLGAMRHQERRHVRDAAGRDDRGLAGQDLLWHVQNVPQEALTTG